MNQPNQELTLNIAAWQERSLVAGPGERFLLWVQGCPFRCRGCINQHFLPFSPRHSMPAEELAEKVFAVRGIEGVTFSGGEPMAQAEGLYSLSRRLRERGLSVVCYSGYTLEELRASQDVWVAKLLDCIDVLIDGRFEESQRTNLLWRGSRNQRVHFLTPRYGDWQARADAKNAEIELRVGEAGYTATGILSRKLLERLEVVMREMPR